MESLIQWGRGRRGKGKDRKPNFVACSAGIVSGWIVVGGGCLTICQMCLPCPPSGYIRLNVGAWWGRRKCLVQQQERETCPRLVLEQASRNMPSLEVGTGQGYDVQLPPLKPWIESPENPNLFYLSVTKLAGRNDGEGGHKVMCR